MTTIEYVNNIIQYVFFLTPLKHQQFYITYFFVQFFQVFMD